MSGVYIPNWEKPKSCDECWAEYAYEICNSHSGTCPLVPVPDHGRLVDADAIEYDEAYLNGHYENGDVEIALREEIDKMPTIIPADKEDGE